MTIKPLVDPEVHCNWCGRGPEPRRIVVTGAGMAICDDCVDLAVVLIEEEKKRG
ncbi:ClpX C4-type zinc finger protein [Nonomuraea wenchangensis]|uniref:ATP-dependent Clp protease ATP-binding subunit ClpX n=1 Tax=Nonomuraea wenchangensis TaxID=568860 RepID=A0A1I0LV64_9ACTN|nr:ClpX C4-type zinc finger protein [Nonomuraea wenchangensis]SEU46349.1 ATP-dependent Clp protease ATP-binding subunit ClpX [Nonomuraea wenchangensis]